MPEGHTIHRLARELGADLQGRTVSADAGQARFRQGARRLDGRTLESATAVGKHLFVRFEGARVLHVHLGLTGRFRRRAHTGASSRPAPSVRLRLDGPGARWELTDPSVCALGTPDIVIGVTRRLGPDPLAIDADPTRFFERTRRSDRAIGELLLDQSVIAGVGNVYRAEVLTLAGIDPHRPGCHCGDDDLTRLWDLSTNLLRSGVELGRIVTVDTRGRRPERLPRTETVNVYQQACCRRCGGRVSRSELGGRTLYWCPACQPS